MGKESVVDRASGRVALEINVSWGVPDANR